MDSQSKLFEWMEALVAVVHSKCKDGKTSQAVASVFEYAKTAIMLSRVLPGGEVDGVKVTRVVVKQAPRSPDKCMLVVQGRRKSKDLVTFHTGSGGAELFHQFLAREAAGTLTWREDTPYVEAAADPGAESLPGLGGP